LIVDTIDLSNLNRQFLFRLKDVGKAKAEVAADFVMKRVKGVKIKHYNRRIETFDKTWYVMSSSFRVARQYDNSPCPIMCRYAQFDYVIAGLDNVQARQWLNAVCPAHHNCN
jgi:ubiquitin-activating enzyme E1 C